MLPILSENRIHKHLKPGRAAAILGARRTGKTFLMERLRLELKGRKTLLLTGDNLDAAEVLSSRRLSVLRKLTAGYDALFVDEAQAVPNICASLKLLADGVPGLSILIAGFSISWISWPESRLGAGGGKICYHTPAVPQWDPI